MPKKFTKEEFVDIANTVHNSRYDYTNTIYINSQSYISINCPQHGEFTQRANAHLRGHKCPKCGRFSMGVTKRRGISFLEAATKKHNGKYDYSKVVYENNRSRVIIGCPVHGDFIQKACCHQQGNGCPKCSRERTRLASLKHGFCNRELYATWLGIIRRCDNQKADNYHRYGGRGIRVSQEFYDFEVFEAYVSSLPNYSNRNNLGLSLDRINNNGNYERGNLRWSTQATQNENKDYWNKTSYKGVKELGGVFKSVIYLEVYRGCDECAAVEARNKAILELGLSYKLQECNK